MNQNFSSSQKAKIQFVIGLLGAGVLALIALLVILFVQISGRKSSAQQIPTVLSTSEIPTMFIPTQDCGTPTLVIGSNTFQIQPIQTEPDGTLTVPVDSSGTAYWVEGTNTHYVFVLSPAPDNLALQSTLATGDLATIFWADCTVATFVVSAVDAGQLNDPSFLDQSIAGMSVFVQTDSSTTGFVVKGELPEEIISVLDTPRPDESGILAEVSLLETSTSPDGATLKVGISILNYGQTAFTLSASNVSLTPQESAPVVLAGSQPSLPKEINPGSTETFIFTFPRPSIQIATLKIFTIEYDIEGY